MYVKSVIVNVNKCLNPFFLDQHINSVNTVTLQRFWFICSFVIFQGIRTSIAKKPYIFVIFQGGLDPLSLPLDLPMISQAKSC